LRDALVCSYYVRCVSTPEIFWADVSVNHSRNRSGKAIDNTQGTSQSSKLLRGYRFAGTTACPRRPQTGLRSSPRSKRMTRPCASRTLLSSCLRGQCRLTLWGKPWTPGAEPTWPPPRPFRRSQLCTLCWPALLRRPLAVRSSTRPQRRRRPLAGFKEVSYYHRVDALRGLSKPCTKDTPFVAGVASATVANVWGSVHSGDEGTAGFRRAACAHTGAVHGGLWIRFSHA